MYYFQGNMIPVTPKPFDSTESAGLWFLFFYIIHIVIFIFFKVRLWDPTTRLLLLRVPRDDCGKVRACLTLWTHYEVPAETKSKRSRIVASVLSVNGSARTAKRSALLQARKWYRGRLIQQESSKSASSSSSIPLMQRKFFDKNCRKLQELITIIQAID